jgi:hypothetical protein
MDLHSSHHDWDVLEQAAPKTTRPFGFVCSCGHVRTATFGSMREAVRAASTHGVHRADAHHSRAA